MIADNRFSTSGTSETPDIFGFLVFDLTGKRVAHGTGSVVSGAFTVRDTGNDDGYAQKDSKVGEADG